MKTNVKKIATMGILTALSIVLMYVIHFPIIPAAPYLKYEPADVPILIGAFLFGPLAGFVITAIEAIIQTLLFGEGGWVGLVMNIIATGTFVVTAGLIYKKTHDRKGAIIGLVCGTLARTLIMIPLNLIIQPNFYGVPLETVKSLLVPAIIPFNLLKSGLNSVITIIVYKSISKVIRKI